MRYNEQVNEQPKQTKKEEKPRDMTKQGSYTSKDLEKSKNIEWLR